MQAARCVLLLGVRSPVNGPPVCRAHLQPPAATPRRVGPACAAVPPRRLPLLPPRSRNLRPTSRLCQQQPLQQQIGQQQGALAGRAAARARLARPHAAAATNAAVAAAADASSAGDGGGPLAAFSRLATALTNAFPVFVLGAALWALARPAAFDWLPPTAITPALAVTMLGMGLTLTFDVRGEWGRERHGPSLWVRCTP